MKTTIHFKFDLQIIKNHVYFLEKNDELNYVYFIPINNQILFFSPFQEKNVYMTLSGENEEIKKINNYIDNKIKNGDIYLSHIFGIDKKEFGEFLKNTNKKSQFTFDLIEDGGISGVCNILKNNNEIDNISEVISIDAVRVNYRYFKLKPILENIFLKQFDFEHINVNQQSLGISLKHISCLYKTFSKFKEKINVSYAKDYENDVSSILVKIGNKENYSSYQILIEKCKMEDYYYWAEEDIL